ncbi:hypothetical protein QO190_12275 [Cloacibacterium sp. Arc13]|uniref:hypothetical protein n=1 Tax=unclassified Cloacibacterium TaxID=2620870 RepID=UPI00352F67F5
MKQASQIKNSYNGYLMLLMLFSPIMGVVKLLRNRDEKTLLLFGIIFFGIAGSLYVYRPGSDGEAHLSSALTYYSDMSFNAFINQFYDLVTLNSTTGAKDIYLHCISYLAASVFGVPELIHVFAGLILGYFFTKSALLVLKDKLTIKKSGLLTAFIVLFIFDRSLGALNSIRMWTGMWVFFYGTYSYVITKKKKFLLVILFSIVVHFSYLIVLIPFLISYILRNRTFIMTGLYLVSFGMSLDFTSVENFLPKTDLVESQQKSNVIDSEEKAEFFQEKAAIANSVKKNFYVTYGEGFYKDYCIVGLSFILLLFYNSKYAEKKFIFLFASGIGLYIFSNLATFSPSLSGRVRTISALFILVSTIQLLFTIVRYKLSRQKMNLLNAGLVIFLLSSVPMFLFQLSYLIQMLSFFSIILAPVSWLLGDADISIRDFFNYLF